MKAEIISIGDELLIGQVINTNAAWLSRELNATGIAVGCVTTVGDDMKVILAAFRCAWKENDVVVVTGGLGPTHDDISKDAVAKFFRKKLVLHKPTLRSVEERFRSLGYAKMPEANVGQAMVPEGFTILPNGKGTAPGLLFREEGKTFVILPGVPYEMEYIMQSGVIPILRRVYKKDLEVILHRTILTTGIGESMLAEKIGDPKEFLGSTTTLAFLPRSSGVRLRISSHGHSRRIVEKEIARVENIIRGRAAKYIFGLEEESLAGEIVKLLTDRKKTLSTAESCTGGLIASQITDVPGASTVFPGSIVAYANTLKIAELDVSESTLARFGAVSEEAAREMAEGIRNRLNTDYALSVTGIAGPGGGTSEKPVGTIWIALADHEKPTIARKLQLAFDRTVNRERSAAAALEMLRRRLLAIE
ncbi:MAG TPA: competence/damage-inducible protein A [Candidatus Kapabacteria bacterium]|nr:competence/damage-inducible protein A [Candidatus Kapabacteria bacterium]